MLNSELAKQWLMEAGEIALRSFRRVEPSLKEDKTLLTQADTDIQAFLKEKFDAHFPEVGIVSEEGLYKPPWQGTTYFVVDPIDGTAAFATGLPIWGIALGVVQNRQPVAGYFYMPVTGDMFYSDTEGPVFRNETPTALRPFSEFQRETLLLSISRFDRKCRVDPRYPGKVRSFGSIVAHICYTATSSADATFVQDCHIWDLAAPMAMLLRNGGSARYLSGETFAITEAMLARERIPEPLLFGHELAVAQFLEVIHLKE